MTPSRHIFVCIAPIILPFLCVVGYLFSGSFLLRSLSTLLCLLISMQAERRVHLPWRASLCPALLFSLCGDYVLGHWGSSFEGFVAGVALFLLAHLGYVTFSLSRGRLNRSWFAALTLIFGVGYYGFFLFPVIGDAVTSGAVLAYILVSCLSMAAAIGIQTEQFATTDTPQLDTSHFTDVPTSRQPYSFPLTYSSVSKAIFVAGIACLLFSDLLIAQRRFLSDSTLYTLMMPTYFASQLLATTSLILHTTNTNTPNL